MKRITPKTANATKSLYELQRNIAKTAARLRRLQEEESALLEEVSPIFENAKHSECAHVKTADGLLDVKYTYVNRQIVDNEKAVALIENMGKKVPMRRNAYSFIRVVKATENKGESK